MRGKEHLIEKKNTIRIADDGVMIVKLCMISLVGEDDVASVDDSGNISEDGEKNVDGQVVSASLLEPDSDWWKKQSAEELWNVGASESHSCNS